MWIRVRRLVGVAVAVLGIGRSGIAQDIPAGPIVIDHGVATISGDVAASLGPVDPGFFNWTDYDRSALRLLIADLSTEVHVGGHFSVLGQIRTENASAPEVFALYVRMRPWMNRRFDVQVGRIPPTFGSFSRRAYPTDNPLIGYPLVYQYLTSLRADALPATTDQLLKMRGSGWLTRYSIGNLAPEHGVPIVNTFEWDTGVQVHASSNTLEVTGAITQGTVSNPMVKDDNSGQQLVGRFAVRVTPGLLMGVSAARGAFVASSAARSAGVGDHTGDFRQTVVGGDVEYAAGHVLLRSELVFSRWTIPLVAEPTGIPLSSLGGFVEGRYQILPGLFGAARVDHLGFSDIRGTSVTEPWDAPVSRMEVGGGYYVQRNLLVKGAVQLNSRDGGPKQSGHYGAAQIVYWF